ncbi:MAG: hypothetical protein K2M95_03720 [Clostridiales bacterium]|nr:hypothetical protein [Clostridiales bacterium]
MKKAKLWILLLCVAVLAGAAVACGDKTLTVSLSASELSVQAGSSAALSVSVSDGSAVTWSSSDPSVAYYEDGAVHGISPGTAVLTASAGSASAECKVTVTSKPVVTPDNVVVTIGSTALELEPENSATLTAGVRINGAGSDKTVSWTTSDPCVTLSTDGNTATVTAVSDGTAKVRAVYDGEYAECTVTVVALNNVIITVNGHKMGTTAPISGGTVTLVNAENPNDKKVNLAVSGTGTVEARLRPIAATYKVTYTPESGSNEQYYDGQITLASDSTAAQVTLEYKRFTQYMTNGWGDYNNNDQSNANDANPTITVKSGSFLDVLSTAYYVNVSASLWVKGQQSNHSNKVHGIALVFDDGKCVSYRVMNPGGSGTYTFQKDAGDVYGRAAIGAAVNNLYKASATENSTAFNAIESSDGYQVTVKKIGDTVALYLGGSNVQVPLSRFTLSGDYADKAVKVGFYVGNTAENSTWKFDIEEIESITPATPYVAVTVKGHKMGEIIDAAGNATLTNVADANDKELATLDANGTATYSLQRGATYKVTLANYRDGEITVGESATTAQVTLEYKRFDYWTGWDTESHDYTHVNDETPTVSMNAADKMVNVRSTDSYNNVAVSMWVKAADHMRDDKLYGIGVMIDGVKGTANRNCVVEYRMTYSGGNYYFKRHHADEAYGNDAFASAADLITIANSGDTAAAFNAIHTGADGYQVTVKKIGNVVALYLGGSNVQVPLSEFTLTGDYANKTVRVGFYCRGIKANAAVKFDIQDLGEVASATQDVAVTVKGHKAGETVDIGSATLTNVADTTDTVTLGESTVTLKKVATYKVTATGYNDGYITVNENATTATTTLEYVRFGKLSWENEFKQLDLSHVNDAEPYVGVGGSENGLLNVLSKDSYNDVSMSFWVNGNNTSWGNKLQGVTIVFNATTCLSFRLLYASNTYTFVEYTGDDYGLNSAFTAQKTVYEASASDHSDVFNKIQSAGGCLVTLKKVGNTIGLYIDENATASSTVDLSTFSGGAYKDQSVKVGFYVRGAKANTTWKFDITDLSTAA